MSTLKPLIVILGPTASGKSEMALKLAKKYNGEIINADSRQIYKEMIIGTGSPIQIENGNIKMKNDNVKFKNKVIKFTVINGIAHRLFHFIRPDRQFSVAEYKILAIKMIRDVHKRNKLPILVGGTGLYIGAIADNLNIPKAPPNRKIRKKLEKWPIGRLFKKLQKVDPTSASAIGPHNKRRMIRALEVYEITGKPFSAQKVKGEPLFDVCEIGIMTDRNKLYKKIDKRVDLMIENGLIKETKGLIRKYNKKLPAMTGIGYKEIGQHLSGELPLPEATQLLKFRTHQYARRQITWFKKDGRIKWISGLKDAVMIISALLKNSQ